MTKAIPPPPHIIHIMIPRFVDTKVCKNACCKKWTNGCCSAILKDFRSEIFQSDICTSDQSEISQRLIRIDASNVTLFFRNNFALITI